MNEPQNSLTIYEKEALKVLEDDPILKKLTDNKRTVEDDWNKPIFEVTNEEELKDCIEKSVKGSFRRLKNTPMFFDGEYLCVFVTYFTKPENDADINTFKDMPRSFMVEMYDPETLEFRNRVPLDIELEGQEASDLKVQEELEHIKTILGCEYPSTVVAASNGKILATGKGDALYFFDLETGKRISDKINLPFKVNGFNRDDSTFWGIDENYSKYELISCKVSGFDLNTESERLINIKKLFSIQLKDALKEMSKSTTKSVEKSTIGLLKRLTKSQTTYDQAQSDAAASKDLPQHLSTLSISHVILEGSQNTKNSIQIYDSCDKSNTELKFEFRKGLFRNSFSVIVSFKFFEQLTIAMHRLHQDLKGDLGSKNLSQQ